MFVTGDVLNERTSRFLSESGAPGLRKPFLIEEVHAVLDRLLNPGNRTN